MDHTTKLWDYETGRLLATLVFFRGGTWIVVDPEGRHDSDSPGDLPEVSWVTPDDPLTLLPVERCLRDCFGPKLFPKILSGARLQPVNARRDLSLVQPKVRVAEGGRGRKMAQAREAMKSLVRSHPVCGLDSAPRAGPEGVFLTDTERLERVFRSCAPSCAGWESSQLGAEGVR